MRETLGINLVRFSSLERLLLSKDEIIKTKDDIIKLLRKYVNKKL